jgi:hypothetical protein
MRRKSIPQEAPPIILAQRNVVFESMELLQVLRNELVLVDRGAVALLRILGQAYDAPNVTALEVGIGQLYFLNIRELDKSLELRLQAAWRKAVLHADLDVDLPKVRVSVVAVLS